MFESVRKAQPSRLYVAADGPRRDRAAEAQACDETRRIATSVDWPCVVQTLFRSGNLGCRVGVSTAIDWFFEHEEEGIILEDDCVPSASFFPYCAELLERFRDDQRIMCISGDNFQRGRSVTPYSYYLSRYMHCWGWATWRRAWRLYDRDMALWPEFRDAQGLRAWSDGDDAFARYWTEIFDAAAAGKIDSWAYRFLFTCWAHNGLSCLPERNLVSNIGFGEESTHTTETDHWQSCLPADELSFPLKHPPFIFRSADADAFEQEHSYGRPAAATVYSRLRRVARDSLPPSVVGALKIARAEIRRRVA